MTLVDALSCPYCGGPLFKESYYFRCCLDHRFRSSVRMGGSPCGDEATAYAGCRAGELLLEVIRHRDRNEVGRVHAFAIPAEDG